MGAAVERPYHNDMKPRMNVSRAGAFTFLELLLLVVAICAVVLGLLLPVMRRGDGSRSTQCLNNLKQVALAQIIWASEHVDGARFPFEVPVNEGGLQEVAVERRSSVSYYRELSNVLGSPKILACPTDRQAKSAEDFAALTSSGVSYFLNVGPTSTNVATVLNGDAKLLFPGREAGNLAGLLSFTNGAALAWQQGMHGVKGSQFGNVAYVDGTCESLRNNELLAAFFPPESSNAVVRLLFP